MTNSPPLSFREDQKDEIIPRLILNSRHDESGCQLWTGAVAKRGYGQISINNYPRTTHRVSYAVFKGPIPRGACVCHKCDVKLCIEPSHLFLGSDADNAHDMRAKGRGKNPPVHVGLENNKVRHDFDVVAEVRRRALSGEHHRALAKEFKTSVSTIGRWRNSDTRSSK